LVHEGSKMSSEDASEIALTLGGRTTVTRKGGVVFRNTGPWAPSVHALLRHLENVGFAAAPKVIGSGFDAQGRETLTYIEGSFVHPHAWSDEGVAAIGRMLRALHEATASFHPPENAIWRQWFGRELGGSPRTVFGHCDVGPWNVVARDGMPIGLIDWEVAGPADFLVQFAQACWLNVQLHDDDIAEQQGLPSAEARARQVRVMADSYGLRAQERAALVDTMVAYAIHDAADQAIQIPVTPETNDATPLWGLAWRTRAAAWMLRNRPLLDRALS
jgi:Ser/Thr protein kinase RdoA (MazF antagonist)